MCCEPRYMCSLLVHVLIGGSLGTCARSSCLRLCEPRYMCSLLVPRTYVYHYRLATLLRTHASSILMNSILMKGKYTFSTLNILSSLFLSLSLSVYLPLVERSLSRSLARSLSLSLSLSLGACRARIRSSFGEAWRCLPMLLPLKKKREKNAGNCRNCPPTAT